MPKVHHEDIVYSLLKNIFRREIKPGDKLPTERKLSDNYQVDRSSLRIALKQLESMGVVDIKQRDGIYVKNYFKYAGIDFLKHLFSHQEDEYDDSFIDEYIIEELFNFHIDFFPIMLRSSLKNFSPRDIKTLLDLNENCINNLHDKKLLVKSDLKFLYIVAERTNNMVYLLLSNSIAPIRKKVVYYLIDKISAEDLRQQLKIQKAIIQNFVITKEKDLLQICEVFRNFLISQRNHVRQIWNSVHNNSDIINNFSNVNFSK